MLSEYLIKSFCKFTKIKEKDIYNYFKDEPKRELRNIIEHPESLNPTLEQLEKINSLKELSNFYTRVAKYENYIFDDSIEMVDYLRSQFMSKSDKENFIVSLLDKENKLLGTEVISTGTLNASIVHPRDVFKQALKYNASKIVLSHNHPSGNPKPSDEDIRITNRLESVGRMFNVDIIDHIIIGREDYYSFKKEHIIIPRNYKVKTENTRHEELFKKDTESFIDKLSKVAKIPKKELKEAINKASIKELIEQPEEYLSKDIYISKINALKNISLSYINSTFFNACKITSPDAVLGFVNTRYPLEDNINVVLLLDTKNQVIQSIKVPKSLSNYTEFKYIMEKAIKYDSNSIILSSKVDNLEEVRTNYIRRDEINEMRTKSEAVGIKILDNVDVCETRYYSYKEKNHFREDEVEYGSQVIKIEDEWDMEI